MLEHYPLLLEFDSAELFPDVRKIKHTAYPYGSDDPIKHILLVDDSGEVRISPKKSSRWLDYGEDHLFYPTYNMVLAKESEIPNYAYTKYLPLHDTLEAFSIELDSLSRPKLVKYSVEIITQHIDSGEIENGHMIKFRRFVYQGSSHIWS